MFELALKLSKTRGTARRIFLSGEKWKGLKNDNTPVLVFVS
jgi:hypothetical protein